MSKQGPSTSIPSSQWKYDVFLSFRGDDTRKGFTDHLYTSLEHYGIRTFKDDQELRKGRAISPELLTAIEESRFALIVLSPHYASSTWCLDELVHILKYMEERGAAMPIFYDVNPSDVRKQTGTFATAFTIHERLQNDGEKVQGWRSTLTKVANLSGWDSRDWNESALIKNVVQEIWTKLPRTLACSTKNLVGIDSRLNKVEPLLDVGGDDVYFIGIWGMGGVGKTTISKVVCERFSQKFDCKIFLPNIRELAVAQSGLLSLQKQLLSGIGSKSDGILDVDEGVAVIRRFFRHKKVLIVLDDVSNLRQLQYLAGARDWFGIGSRIMITTRDDRLLIQHRVERRFKVEELNDDEALQLLSWQAFNKPSPEQNYLAVCSSVVNYAKGLPLALEVIGSSLRGRSPSGWDSALGKFRKIGNPDILEVLRISYDNLDAELKNCFLDSACFFKGVDKDHVVKTMDACGFYGEIGIDDLTEKSLIEISSNRIWMHDLIEEMGRQIVLEESNLPGERSRLWCGEDIDHVLSQNTGTNAIQCIQLNSPDPTVVDHPDAFVKMTNLRMLNINSRVHLPNGLTSLPNSLRIIDWIECPLKSLPPSFAPKNLVEIKMCRSNIENLWTGIQLLPHLKTINLSHSLNLVKTPDFRGIPYLESLILEGCTRLYEVDQSLGKLDGLTLLNLKDCKSLVRFPSSVNGLKSLKVINLSGCTKLDRLPDDLGYTESLEELVASGTAIRVVPCSFGRLERLTLMNLKNCKNLGHLPNSVDGLKSLKVFNLAGCSKLDKLPNELGSVVCLEELDVSGTAIREPPSSIGLLRNLKGLSFHGCRERPSSISWITSFLFSSVLKRSSDPIALSLPSLSGLRSLTKLDLSDCDLVEEAILNDIGSLTSLEILNLSRNHFVTLQGSICKLPKLRLLRVEYCQRLQKLAELPCGLEVWADNCISLETLSHSIKPRNMRRCEFLSSVYCINCFKLVEKQGCKTVAVTLLGQYLQEVPCGGKRFAFVIPGNEIPECFKYRSVGSSVSVELEPGWSTDELMGYAVCAVFAVHEHQTSLKSDICCQLEVNGKMLFPAPVFLDMPRHMGQAESDHLWLFYVPDRGNHHVNEWQDVNNQLELSFEIDGPGLEMKKCGIFLINKS